MDGRWKLCLAGGLLAGSIGCNTAPKQLVPPNSVVQQPKPTPMQLAKAPPPPPAGPQKTGLKPDTYVKMGALKEEAAEDGDRSEGQREALRHDARLSYQKAIDADPKYVPAHVALAKSYWASNDKDRAQAAFAKAVALAPNDANLWFEQGAAQARAKEFPAAVQSLTRAAQLDPQNKNTQKLLGFTLARGGWYEEALNALVKAMPEAEARYNLGRMMQHNRQGDAADVQLRLAAQMDANFEPARAALPGGDGVRQAGYQAPAARPAADPQPVAPATVPPVMLGGTGS